MPTAGLLHILQAALRRPQSLTFGPVVSLDFLRTEHLLHLPDEHLQPWLLVTGMILAGEMVGELQLGVVVPILKNEGAFRPITLLEPIYKCCTARVSERLAQVLHRDGLLESSQFGFVVGSRGLNVA